MMTGSCDGPLVKSLSLGCFLFPNQLLSLLITLHVYIFYARGILIRD